jgi:hypothetical protein
MIGRVKGSSSNRLSEKGVLGFAWQNGYGAFSVSESSVEAVTAYISDRAEHHRKFSYQEELRELLKRHRVPGLKPWAVFRSSFGRLEYAQENVQTAGPFGPLAIRQHFFPTNLQSSLKSHV